MPRANDETLFDVIEASGTVPVMATPSRSPAGPPS
jgi:hypothetical protein